MMKMIIPSILIVVFLINKSIAQNCQQDGCRPGFCCSRWGFCGDTALHCDPGPTNPTSNGNCQPPCGRGFCCSRWGFCGDTPLHCEGGQVDNINGGICQPPCGPNLCCSRWGFCGNTPLHCAGTQPGNGSVGICQPPCGRGLCCSRWGYCGNTPLHCSSGGGGGGGSTSGTTARPQTTTTPIPNETTMTRQRFDCIFDQLSPTVRDQRWNGFQEALTMVPFQPQNQDELMMFFAHVSHETDGLKTYEEYCGRSGQCADDYQNSWCSPIQAEPDKQYYGRGWFQLSWPCNYDAAGKALGVDFLKYPELVAESDTYAAATAIWFWNTNNMGQPARNGNFAGTTSKINSIECGSTPQQDNRIQRYQKVRQCYGLNPATTNLRC